MEEINFQLVTLDQLPDLQFLSKRTFVESFSSVNTVEDMENYTSHHFSENQLKKEVLNPHSQFYLIKRAKQLVGYFKINEHTAQNEFQHSNELELERIYLLEEFQNLGLGTIILEYIEMKAVEMKKRLIWLGVWEQNRKAIRFYERYGYCYFGQHDFVLGNDVQVDFLLKKELD